MEPTPIAFSARSKRQAMEWNLVLASQGISGMVDFSERGWELIVDPPDFAPAQDAIRLYQLENRGWRWKQTMPVTGLTFHWGSAVWVAVLAAIYYWSMVRFRGAKDLGMVDSHAVEQGQWWRLFTAVTLHENLPHLLANETTGFLLWGLAMARYGPGIALLTTFLAGALGNYAGLFLYDGPHQSLGASGMVTAALGLMTTQSFAPWRQSAPVATFLVRAGSAGVLILVLIGFSPGVDIVAHVAGFVAGAVFGLALGWVRPASLQRGPLNLACGLALAGLLFATWRLAVRGS